MKRRLFCEISPLTYKISLLKNRAIRHVKNSFIHSSFSVSKQTNKLPILVYKHNSLIRRKLGNVDLKLQDNKAVNLRLASEKITGVIINKNEVFSFWELVGKCSSSKGYLEGLLISKGCVSKGIGGGMCQLTNLIHWLVLHTPLDIIEHHHHDQIDLFKDYGRKVPFGTGTSIMYNYLDYRFVNKTDNVFQLIIYTDEEYLHGEIRTDKPLNIKCHIKAEDEFFSNEDGVIYRNGKVYRICNDKDTGKTLSKELIKLNHARVLYDTEGLDIKEI